MKPLGEIIKEQNIFLATTDPIVRGGFSQIPNFILKDPSLSIGAKVTYAMFLTYTWQNNFCFPGQERLAADMGMSRPSVTAFIGELEKVGLISIQRRGQGRTNFYTIHSQVKGIVRRRDVSRLTSRGQPITR